MISDWYRIFSGKLFTWQMLRARDITVFHVNLRFRETTDSFTPNSEFHRCLEKFNEKTRLSFVYKDWWLAFVQGNYKQKSKCQFGR